MIPFASWRIAGGALQTQELVVRRKVREWEIGKYQRLYVLGALDSDQR